MKIRKAIIPVAGMGTRFLPATKAQPKEMLPVVDKPVIQYIVESAVAAGIEEIIFVTALGKRAIEDHFDRNFELEYRLEQKGKLKELNQIQEIGKLAKFAFVRQAKPLGDGHALLSAAPFIGDDEPVAVLFGDDFIDGEVPSVKQMIDVFDEHGEPVIGLVEVPEHEVSKYGVIGGDDLGNGTYQIDSFIEKPEPDEAPSNLIAPGQYIITPEVLESLKTQAPGKGGEIRLADAFISRIEHGKLLHGKVLEGKRFDCGNKLEFIKAQIEFGLKHPEVQKGLKDYLDTL
jgi:UTP--glucose-1-phosphate uridylyltransferase